MKEFIAEIFKVIFFLVCVIAIVVSTMFLIASAIRLFIWFLEGV